MVSWVVRDDGGRVVGVYTTEKEARSNRGRGRFVVDPQPDGGGLWVDDVPAGWQLERVVVEPLSVGQPFAVTELMAACDGGCSQCMADLVRLARRLWPDVDWDAELRVHSHLWPPDPDDWPDLAAEFGGTHDA